MSAFDLFTNFKKGYGISSVRIGYKKPVLETEFNEMQEIQNQKLKDSLYACFADGYLVKGTITYSSPTFIIAGYKLIFNGEVIDIDSLTLSITSGNIYLDVWDEDFDYTESLKAKGNYQNVGENINYFLDNRVDAETSRRMVTQYNLSATNSDSTHRYMLIGSVSIGVFTSSLVPATPNSVSVSSSTPNPVDTTGSAGSASTFSRSDHVHAIANSAIISGILTGLSTATNAVITATDNILAALGKLQAQITAHTGATTGVHGASILATANTIAQRDSGGSLTATNIITSGEVQINSVAPIVEMVETDTGKKWYIVSDGSNFSIREDNTGTIRFTISPGGVAWINGNTVWHSGNLTAAGVASGTFPGMVRANAAAASDLNTYQIRNGLAGTGDLVAGSTALETGTLYYMYE